ncbi:MAG: YHS domain-containing protein [Candidatus Thorarchaeota archaeon]
MEPNNMVNSDDSIASLSIELDDTLCPSCVTALTSTLMKYQGVVKATVKPLHNNLILEYIPDRISRNSLEEIVKSAVVENTVHHENHSNGTAIDPVCRMTVNSATTKLYSDFEGTRYFFCALSCKIAFDENPASYLNGDDIENNA